MVNRNESVPNIYRLYDKDRKFIREVAIETPDYAVVDLYRVGDKYYVRSANWNLYETECWHARTED